MRLSRHAKNRLRRYVWRDPTAVMALIAPANEVEPDRRGNPRYRGVVHGRVVTVVVALDNPDYIITIYPR